MTFKGLPLTAVLILIASVGACVAPPQTDSGLRLRPRDALPNCSDNLTNPTIFINKAYTLLSRYDPANTNPYIPPAGVLPLATTDQLAQYRSDLAAAYCAASPSFKKQLDDLTGVFLTCDHPDNCAPSGQNVFATSWGFREGASNQSVLQHTYLALSVDLWSGQFQQSPGGYSNFEYAIIDNLLRPATNPKPANQYLTISIKPAEDTFTMALLAALAHEAGHIYWVKTNTINNFTCKDQFPGNSWGTPPPPKQFHRFGEDNGDVISGGRPGLQKVIKDINNGQDPKNDLHKIYNGDWASLFATVSPNEQFVETYKLWTLASSGLSSFSVKVGPFNPIELVQSMNNGGGDLEEKASFIQDCYAWP